MSYCRAAATTAGEAFNGIAVVVEPFKVRAKKPGSEDCTRTVWNSARVAVPSCTVAKAIGAIVTANLLAGGFAGDIWLVNPNRDSVGGVPCYKTLASVPGIPDLAVIASPPETVPQLIDELGRKGCRAAVVITAGISGNNS